MSRPAARGQAASVCFDLDLTLVDTRAATAHALGVVNRTLGTTIDADAFVAELGLAMDEHLARWVPAGLLDRAGDVFRQAFTTEGLELLRPARGAHDLVDVLRRYGVPAAVVTSRRPEVARRCLESVGIPLDRIAGGVTGLEKVPALRELGAAAYVGDHALDMAAAVAAEVVGVGVTTGNHTADELLAAGADIVVPSLEAMCRWSGAWASPAGRDSSQE